MQLTFVFLYLCSDSVRRGANLLSIDNYMYKQHKNTEGGNFLFRGCQVWKMPCVIHCEKPSRQGKILRDQCYSATISDMSPSLLGDIIKGKKCVWLVRIGVE